MISIAIIRQNKYLLMALVATIIMVLLPSLNLILRKDIAWNDKATILANINYGAPYYNARIREIKDGNIFIGNPYFLEHSESLAPAFFVADWVAVAPLLLGLSYNTTIIFNAFFWSLIFVFLSYFILRALKLSKGLGALGSIIVYSQGFHLMLTPVSMQTIFPFFLLVLLALILWFEDPFNKKRICLLTTSIASSFYVYTYLWQITLVFVFLCFLFLLITKRKREAFFLVGIIVSAMLLSLPLIVYTIFQTQHPDYWDTMFRIGLELNRLPMAEAYYSGRWILFMVILWCLSLRWLKFIKLDQSTKKTALFFIFSGLSLLIASLSNIITGRDLELPGHVARFMAIWLPLSLIVYFTLFFKPIKFFKDIQSGRNIILFILLIFSLGGIAYFSRGYFDFLNAPTSDYTSEFLTYVPPLLWLEQNEAKPVVILVDPKDNLQTYITTLTKHYLLFANAGILHLVSSQEIEERYLVASYFKNLTQQDLEDDFKNYAGTGNAVHPYKTHNRKVKLCRLLRLSIFGAQCGELTDAVSFKGKEYFEDLYQKYKNDIKPNINQEIKNFHVSYIIRNKQLDPENQIDYYIKEIKGAQPVYSDDDFSIFKIE